MSIVFWKKWSQIIFKIENFDLKENGAIRCLDLLYFDWEAYY